jgi:hypothetical protein
MWSTKASDTWAVSQLAPTSVTMPIYNNTRDTVGYLHSCASVSSTGVEYRSWIERFPVLKSMRDA